MDQQHIGVAIHAHLQGLAGADCHSFHFVAGLLFKDRDQVIQQA